MSTKLFKENRQIATINRLASNQPLNNPLIFTIQSWQKYMIQSFVLATDALIWSLLCADLAAMVITGIHFRRSSKFVSSINRISGKRCLVHQQIN